MTTDTLIAEVLDEAESIVRAEWLRLLTAEAPGHCTAERTETPATRPRPPKLALRGVKPDGRSVALPACRRHRSATRSRSRRVWPSQRSPP
ncbi:hypothetical protein [Mycolicibacter longobardus]|uniref:hypothetical protein n=1 Tax=Mycolicibacter longobardus TaxID=1108812 RepID=UPI001054FF8E|nr:hypothetical protein [Mycolicibacter longobardus]MCV7383670.1 hypothetical protein [Mycolicibacter longobardus]